jgi:DNA-binding PadR family transcriptional regulator
MIQKKREILLHPIRMRIFTEVTGGNATAKTIGAAMPDVPPATLYRHINKLVEAGFLQVVEEIPIRGTVERVYGIGTSGLSPEELRGMGTDELRLATNMILGGFLIDFERYLETRQVDQLDPIAEGFDFTKSQIHLSDKEYFQLREDLWAILQPVINHNPSPERRRRVFSFLFIPLEGPKGE